MSVPTAIAVIVVPSSFSDRRSEAPSSARPEGRIVAGLGDAELGGAASFLARWRTLQANAPLIAMS